MADKTLKIQMPGVGMVDAVEVAVDEATERWTDLKLADGTTIRIKTVVLGVLRIEGQFDPDGNPMYQIKANQIMTASAPDRQSTEGRRRLESSLKDIFTMRRRISTTTQTPSIVIIQGAYDKFCAPAEVSAVYENACSFGVILAYEPVSVAATREDWLRFQALVFAWQRERGAMSSTTDAAMCPAYQSIIGMGDVAVPLILKQLEDEGEDPDQWFWALTAITQAAPEKPEDAGNFVKMAASWFAWAKNNGYAW